MVTNKLTFEEAKMGIEALVVPNPNTFIGLRGSNHPEYFQMIKTPIDVRKVDEATPIQAVYVMSKEKEQCQILKHDGYKNIQEHPTLNGFCNWYGCNERKINHIAYWNDFVVLPHKKSFGKTLERCIELSEKLAPIFTKVIEEERDSRDIFPKITKIGNVVPDAKGKIYNEEYTRGLRNGIGQTEAFGSIYDR